MTRASLAVVSLLKTYPALSAALVNFGVFVAGYFGLHITAEQLVMYVGVADVLFGLVVHSNVTPVSKLKTDPVAVVNRPVASADAGRAVISAMGEYSRRGEHVPGSTAVNEIPPPPPVLPGPAADETQAMPAEPPREIVHEAIVPLEGGKDWHAR